SNSGWSRLERRQRSSHEASSAPGPVARTSPDAEVFVGDEWLEDGATIDDVRRFRVHEHEERPSRMRLQGALDDANYLRHEGFAKREIEEEHGLLAGWLVAQRIQLNEVDVTALLRAANTGGRWEREGC